MEKRKLGFGCMRLPLLNRDDQESVDMERFNRLVDTILLANNVKRHVHSTSRSQSL